METGRMLSLLSACVYALTAASAAEAAPHGADPQERGQTPFVPLLRMTFLPPHRPSALASSSKASAVIGAALLRELSRSVKKWR